jgi:hypothetical protein
MMTLKDIYQQTANTTNSGEPDHIYVNVNITNNNLKTCAPTPLIFDQIKSNNIVNDLSEYHASIIRFTLDSTIPVIVPEMDLNQTKIPQTYLKKTAYYINMGYGLDMNNVDLVGSNTGTTNEGQCVLFIPDNQNETLYPNYAKPQFIPETQVEVLNNPYFWLSSIKAFLDMLNITLYELFITAKNKHAPALNNSTAPEFVWNSSANRIDLIVPVEFIFDPRITPIINPTFFITINAPLYSLLNTFSFTCVRQYNSTTQGSGVYNISNYRDGVPFFFNLYSNTGIETISVPAGILVYRFESEASSISAWTPCSSIVFTSYSIPVNSTDSGIPQFTGKNPFENSAVNTVSNTLTDFEIQDGAYSNTTLTYSPPGEYRLFSLNSTQSLNRLNIQVFWLSKYGTYHPFQLAFGASGSLKLMFRKKDFNNKTFD